MKLSLGATALAVTAVLALPAVASAHPSVYITYANVVKPDLDPQPGDPVELEEQVRYLVVNHGYPFLFREDNELNAKSQEVADRNRGVVGYNLIPGAWREDGPKDFAAVMATGATGVQAHATCVTPALTSEPAITGWQDDAFYNYVPFQATSAGLDDDPAAWLPTLTAAGFDITKLGTAAAAEAECEKVAGARYVKADAIQSRPDQLASGTLAHEVEPLEAQIDTLTADKTALTGEVNTLTKERDSLKATVFQTSPLQSQVDALTQKVAEANTQVAALTAKAAPMQLTLADVSASGAKANVTGQPASKVTVRLLITEGQARRLGLRSVVLASTSATTAADGTAGVTLKLSKAAKKALRAFRGSVTAEAISGDRIATATSRLARR